MSLSGTRWSWIDAAGRGEDSALQEFVRKDRPAIVAYCGRRGQGEESEDIAQEVLLRILQGGLLSRADPSRGRFRSLLFVVTRNVLADHLDRATAQKRGGGAVKALGDADVADSVEPDETFDRDWLAHLLDLAMARLKEEHPSYHETLAAFFLEGLAQGDVAERLGATVQTVKNRVHRGKRKLIEYLREEIWNYSSSQEEYSTELEHLIRYLPE